METERERKKKKTTHENAWKHQNHGVQGVNIHIAAAARKDVNSLGFLDSHTPRSVSVYKSRNPY